MFEGERSLSNKGIPDTDSAFYQEIVRNMFTQLRHVTMSISQIGHHL